MPCRYYLIMAEDQLVWIGDYSTVNRFTKMKQIVKFQQTSVMALSRSSLANIFSLVAV